MVTKIKYIFLSFIICANPVVADNIAEGKVTFDRKKGNCLACHMIEDGELAGNNGPPLVAMKARFPKEMTCLTRYGSNCKPFFVHAAIWKTRRDTKRKLKR